MISAMNIVRTCITMNAHTPQFVNTGMKQVYWWRSLTMVNLFSIIQFIVHMTLNNVKSQLLSDFLGCFCLTHLEILYKIAQ